MWVGPREYLKGHLWFGYYHTISLVPFLLYGLIIYLLMKYRLSFHIHRPGILYLLGLLILVWQFTEMGESFARHLKPITPYENINFADVLSYQVKGFAVYMIHTSSILFGIMFLHLGR